MPELRALVPCDLARTSPESLPLLEQHNHDEVSSLRRDQRSIWVPDRQDQKRTATWHSINRAFVDLSRRPKTGPRCSNELHAKDLDEPTREVQDHVPDEMTEERKQANLVCFATLSV
jgi:hypothetical protein